MEQFTPLLSRIEVIWDYTSASAGQNWLFINVKSVMCGVVSFWLLSTLAYNFC